MGNLALFGLALSSDYSAITASVVDSMENVGSSAMSMIAELVPVAVTVAGAVIVVSIGMRVFKRIAGR